MGSGLRLLVPENEEENLQVLCLHGYMFRSSKRDRAEIRQILVPEKHFRKSQFREFAKLAWNLEWNSDSEFGTEELIRDLVEADAGRDLLDRMIQVTAAIQFWEFSGHPVQLSIRLAALVEARLAAAEAKQYASQLEGGVHLDDLTPGFVADLEARLRAMRRDDCVNSDQLEAEETLETTVPSRFSAWSEQFRGYAPGKLIVIAGRPGAGKTAYALHEAMHLARTWETLFFTMEMDPRELVGRMDQIEPDHRSKLRIRIMESKVYDLTSILAAAARYSPGLVVVDYLQMMRLREGYGQLAEKLGEVVQGLKQLALDQKLCVFLLSQLNREGDEEPKLRHLKGTGDLEQAADAAFLLNKENGMLHVNLAKQRNGPNGKQQFDFNGLKITDPVLL